MSGRLGAPRRRQILLRADASLAIGTGHIVRCLTLTRELVARGWGVTLASRGLHPALADDARAAGAVLIHLPPDRPIDQEPVDLGDYVGDPYDVLLADHYLIGATWHRAARPLARLHVVFDDLADRTLGVDLVVNPNLSLTAEAYSGRLAAGGRALIGPSYALIDPSFRALRSTAEARTGVRSLLVFVGGADPRDVTPRAVRAAAGLGLPVDVVVGALYPGREALLAWAAGTRVTVDVATRDMAALMARADLAVGAPSTASWERCTVGLPAVLVTVADNQVGNARGLVAAGAAVELWATRRR